jgi:hypothetical protein
VVTQITSGKSTSRTVCHLEILALFRFINLLLQIAQRKEIDEPQRIVLRLKISP